jgi:hypothetical protein
MKPFGEQANVMQMQAHCRHWAVETTFKKQADLRRAVKVYQIGSGHL